MAACALGGTSLAGGKGSELGTILGVFTVAIIENGMNFIGVNAYYQNIVFGGHRPYGGPQHPRPDRQVRKKECLLCPM